ncbi:MAG TPA: hypothetical protein VH724_19650, partial [Candidatus Angelobacter sp.]|nr:hypothetical protein [Candidatus Angelobacter sp.]
MARFHFIIGGIVLFGAICLPAQTIRPGFPGPRPTPPPGVTPQQQQPTVQPGTATPNAQGQQAPAQQARPEVPGSPAVAPVVTYRDGMLTVQAVNSNLSSVVSAIRNKAGIEFEGAENVSERVALSLGPAPEGEVLAAIFSGSKYDFVA